MRRLTGAAQGSLTAMALVGLVGLAGCAGNTPSSAPFERATFMTVPGADGHFVPVTIYRPEAAGPVPVVLHSHGWGGSRDMRLEAFHDFTDVGLAVVSFDMRGHGEARGTSQSRVVDSEAEIQDVVRLIDFLAAQDWVRKEADAAPNVDGPDPVLGAMGESYGGAYTLLVAAADGRVDAIVAKDTWHDLAQAMAPNGVPKTAWFASLWLSGATQASLHPDVRTGFETAIRTNRVPDGTTGEPDLLARFRASSPSTHATVDASALLIQGTNDTLFDLGQALDNQAMLQARGAGATLVANHGGHRFAGQAPSRGEDPCGDPGALTVAYFRATLRGHDAVRPRACTVLSDGSKLPDHLAPGRPTPLRPLEDVTLHVRPGDQGSRDGALAGFGTYAFGRPRIEGTASAPEGGIVYFGIAENQTGRLAHGQVSPLRLQPGTHPFTLDLPAVAVPGGDYDLVVLGHHELFATPAAPVAAASITDLRLGWPDSAR